MNASTHVFCFDGLRPLKPWSTANLSSQVDFGMYLGHYDIKVVNKSIHEPGISPKPTKWQSQIRPGGGGGGGAWHSCLHDSFLVLLLWPRPSQVARATAGALAVFWYCRFQFSLPVACRTTSDSPTQGQAVETLMAWVYQLLACLIIFLSWSWSCPKQHPVLNNLLRLAKI